MSIVSRHRSRMLLFYAVIIKERNIEPTSTIRPILYSSRTIRLHIFSTIGVIIVIIFSTRIRWVFFLSGFSLTCNSRIIGQQLKGRSILTLLYHFHPLHEYLGISWAINADSSLFEILLILMSLLNKIMKHLNAKRSS